ncbi:uncharacterized protein LOC131928021 [Physella acuta]|uniref:uncharacterized protein LOC131928021 n=1 Tax=Physella acuta TaxID=109671 RepID=UPI0027DB4C04|nr:uncharacterized protein LOC131928021 [Physella acuta]
MTSLSLLLLGLALVAFLVVGQPDPQPSATPEATVRVPSDRLLRILHLLSGFVSGVKQVEENKRRNVAHPHALVESYLIPVYVPALGQVPTFYAEEFVDNVLKRRQLVTVYEDKDANIRVTPHNITVNPRLQRNGTLDTEVLYNLTVDDITSNHSCSGHYDEPYENVFVGIFPDCSMGHDMNNPKIIGVTTCHYSRYVITYQGSKEGPNPVPYELNKLDVPLLPYMMAGKENFTITCGPKPLERQIQWPA